MFQGGRLTWIDTMHTSMLSWCRPNWPKDQHLNIEVKNKEERKYDILRRRLPKNLDVWYFFFIKINLFSGIMKWKFLKTMCSHTVPGSWSVVQCCSFVRGKVLIPSYKPANPSFYNACLSWRERKKQPFAETATLIIPPLPLSATSWTASRMDHAVARWVKGTQEWEFFWLRFWILYYFIVSYVKILRFCKKNFLIGPVLEEVRFFHVVLGLRGMKKIFELGQKNIFLFFYLCTLYMS